MPNNRCRIKSKWENEGMEGEILGVDIFVNSQWWTPVVWGAEKDPAFFKTAGLEKLTERWLPMTAKGN